ncbi:hypothetical protein ECTPHS_05005 [Ectothiorhodospira sp. PHS-1]|nr:hypothetical protein ECTPHS_05005 [Ectothiorhodospira sp. PHS-1]
MGPGRVPAEVTGLDYIDNPLDIANQVRTMP